jgi:glycosyltransferase involved in cell wall biosynthesis
MRILFVKPWDDTFIDGDLKILERHFDVKVANVPGDLELRLGDGVRVSRAIRDLTKGLVWADAAFTWFAGTHANLTVKLARILQKKVVLVVGGYEVAEVPDINYGALLDHKKAKSVEFVLKRVDKIIAVSEFSKGEIMKYGEFPDIQMIYNAIDTQKFSPSMGKKEDIVITVGIITKQTIKRKGLETFLKAAALVPETQFVLIGPSPDDSVKALRAGAGKNVEFAGRVSEEALIDYYQRAKVYCQLSRHEAFGVALAESMSCECVPVVTFDGALPEVVGETGFYAPYGDSEETVVALRQALSSDKGKAASERVKNLFSFERREEEIVRTVEGVCRGK